jgi:hypothetical protein
LVVPGDGADIVNVRGGGGDGADVDDRPSATDVFAGEGSDTINVASLASGTRDNPEGTLDGHLDLIRGNICILGEAHDAETRTVLSGATSPDLPFTVGEMFMQEQKEMAVGDTLNVVDVANDNGNGYFLDSEFVRRVGGPLLQYGQIETLNLYSGSGHDEASIAFPNLPSVVTFDGGGNPMGVDGVDRLTVVGDDEANVISIGEKTMDDPMGGNVRSPLEIANVELLQVFGGNGDDLIANHTSTPSLLQGMEGSDIMVGGSSTDVLVAGGGPDALYGNEGSDFLLADLKLISIDVSPQLDVTVETQIKVANGDLVLGNLGKGNEIDPGVFDEGVALVNPGGGNPDNIDEVESVFENGAIKGVWSWLRAQFPIPSPQSLQDLAERAIRQLLVVSGAVDIAPSNPMVQLLSANSNHDIRDVQGEQLNVLDVNADGAVTARDVLSLISELNRGGGGRLDEANSRFDTNQDGYLTPSDVLFVIRTIHLESESNAQLRAPAKVAAVDEVLAAFSASGRRNRRLGRQS